MIFLLVLLALIIWAVGATVVEVRRDGYRQTPTDWGRVADLDRAESAPVYR